VDVIVGAFIEEFHRTRYLARLGMHLLFAPLHKGSATRKHKQDTT
jgi:hypothetical protein